MLLVFGSSVPYTMNTVRVRQANVEYVNDMEASDKSYKYTFYKLRVITQLHAEVFRRTTNLT